jgi:hypothetical protein
VARRGYSRNLRHGIGWTRAVSGRAGLLDGRPTTLNGVWGAFVFCSAQLELGVSSSDLAAACLGLAVAILPSIAKEVGVRLAPKNRRLSVPSTDGVVPSEWFPALARRCIRHTNRYAVPGRETPLMEIDRSRLNAEEAWIAKYRAALTVPPIQPSRLMKVRVALNSAHGVLIAHMEQILERWTHARWRRPAASSEPVLVPEPQTLTRKMNRVECSGKQPSKKVTAAMGWSGLPSSKNRYRAG